MYLTRLLDVSTQVWILSWLHVILVLVICYQTYMLTRIVAYPIFGILDIIAWLLFLVYRFYGMWGLSEQLELAKNTGFLADHLTVSQYVNLSGTTVFLLLKILSRHLERMAIKRGWGI